MTLTGYCGVDCAACSDYHRQRCPGCRQSTWPDGDICPPIACCQRHSVDCCGRCPQFPCPMMSEFYQESDSHQKAYEWMCTLRQND